MPNGKIDWESLTYETNTNAAIGEWGKKYVHTYVWLNQKHLLFVQEYHNGYLHFLDAEGNTIKLKPNTENSIDVAFPKVGLFQFGPEMLSFMRVPARQYKKAPCEGNSRISSPSAPLWGGNINRGLSFETILAAFKADYLSLDAALYGIQKGKATSAALSEKWGVSKHPKGDQFVLWYMNYPVAEITDRMVTHKVVSFAQEIRDYVRDANLSLEVV